MCFSYSFLISEGEIETISQAVQNPKKRIGDIMLKKKDGGVIHEFYAVTSNENGGSIYKVSDTPDDTYGHATATKIALHGKSSVQVGGKFGSSMIAVCKCLIAYIPEGGGITSFARQIEDVNTRYWGGNTSLIVALFHDLESSTKCFGSADLVPCDPRWLTETEAVIKAIGDEHTFFSVSHCPDLRLLP